MKRRRDFIAFLGGAACLGRSPARPSNECCFPVEIAQTGEAVVGVLRNP
jgi:hypothetical protein